MPLKIRMLPPPAVGQQTQTVNGRKYSAAPGTAVDVPDMDGAVLAANGWIRVAASGTTVARPTTTSVPYGAAPGAQFWDTTLSKLIVFDGLTWRDPNNGNVV